MNTTSILSDLTSWLFGIAVLAIGLINTFWGNDPFFGVFLFLLSLLYFPPVNTVLRRKYNLSFPPVLKIILGLFILWASLGVGELFDKIQLMTSSL